MQSHVTRINDVKLFIKHSVELQETIRLCNNMQGSEQRNYYRDIVTTIEKALSIREILEITQYVDYKKLDENNHSFITQEISILNRLKALRDRAHLIVSEDDALEKILVIKLISNSNAIKTMQNMAQRAPSIPILATLNTILRANTFSDLLNATQDLDIESHIKTDPLTHSLGLYGTKSMIWAGSFINSHAAIAYQLRLLREDTFSMMTREGYGIADDRATSTKRLATRS